MHPYTLHSIHYIHIRIDVNIHIHINMHIHIHIHIHIQAAPAAPHILAAKASNLR